MRPFVLVFAVVMLLLSFAGQSHARQLKQTTSPATISQALAAKAKDPIFMPESLPTALQVSKPAVCQAR